MLSIFLAEELERFTKGAENGMFLEYFCDNKDDKRNTADSIIRGLIFQMLELRPNLFNHILPTFSVQKESLFSGTSFESIWRIFKAMVCDPQVGTIKCILDGLDECDEVSLEALLWRFKSLFSAQQDSLSCHLNLIVVSRRLPEIIPESLSGFPHIPLDPDADNEVNQDINRFINVKVDDLASHGHYPESLYAHVKQVFQDRAQGTFLWVGIVAKLSRKYKATEVEKGLEIFPSGLEGIYARMLLQIDIERREVAAKILRWVVMAVRPLTLLELSAAIEPATGSSAPFSADEVIRDQVSHCGYFLTIKENEVTKQKEALKGDEFIIEKEVIKMTEVSLIHQSAKDYLLKGAYDTFPELGLFHVDKKAGDLEIARKCFHYLQAGALSNGPVDLQKDTSHLNCFPLLDYAVLHWHKHASSLACSDDIFDLSLPFYKKHSQIREFWLETYLSVHHIYLPDASRLLHVASWSCILPLAENLLRQKGFVHKVKRLHHVNRKDSEGRTALWWAAAGRHVAMVQLLLEKGANIEAKDRTSSTALYIAASRGYKDIVQLLLEKRANIEAKNEYGQTALSITAFYGYKDIPQLFLEKGADIEAKNKYGWTAFHWEA